MRRLPVTSCATCGGSRLRRYPYRNHQRRALKPAVLRAHATRLLAFATSSPRWQARTLFSPRFDIACCESCGYGRYEAQLDRDDLDLYYQSLYDDLLERIPSVSDDYLNDDRAVGQWAFVREALTASPGSRALRLLEVGAGDAFSSLHVRHQLPQAAIDVVEPGERWSSYYAARAIRRVARFFPFPVPERYDYIHLSHCLEHVPDLDTSLAALHDSVAETGFVFVEVPNCTAEYWSDDTWDPDGHIHYFTESSLTRLFSSAGFEPVRVGVVGMTHGERNRFWRSPADFAPEIVERARRSVRENVPQPDGEYLRALFKRRSSGQAGGAGRAGAVTDV